MPRQPRSGAAIEWALTDADGTAMTHYRQGYSAHPVRQRGQALHTGRSRGQANDRGDGFRRTIHRLLEADPQRGGFKRGDDNPPDCDLLVVGRGVPPISRWMKRGCSTRQRCVHRDNSAPLDGSGGRLNGLVD